jgi:hypothetical protein
MVAGSSMVGSTIVVSCVTDICSVHLNMHSDTPAATNNDMRDDNAVIDSSRMLLKDNPAT